MMREFTIAEQIAEVEREIKIRERVYMRWVGSGKLTQQAADIQIGRMRAVVETLKRVMVELPDREPGKLITGEVFGPAKVREVERARILGALSPLVSDSVMYRLEAQLQAIDSGKATRKS